ncbi:hypothetical protein BDW02DRAFT_267169 [Decorospora gaudefroyi]|uniref:Uncharacterized protein n=1 Tax=Decorospora gaudefroyi TaxID=184978 RepID=A0A6A5KJ14_9PLEO|nr:hypothetical protein BDW02DRAFT_267169 [Decorospora gaudefroyi]
MESTMQGYNWNGQVYCTRGQTPKKEEVPSTHMQTSLPLFPQKNFQTPLRPPRHSTKSPPLQPFPSHQTSPSPPPPTPILTNQHPKPIVLHPPTTTHIPTMPHRSSTQDHHPKLHGHLALVADDECVVCHGSAEVCCERGVARGGVEARVMCFDGCEWADGWCRWKQIGVLWGSVVVGRMRDVGCGWGYGWNGARDWWWSSLFLLEFYASDECAWTAG